MFVDENPLLLLAACGRAIGEVVAPATNSLFRASIKNPRSAGGGWSKNYAVSSLLKSHLCVCVCVHIGPAGCCFRICELETFGTREWAISSGCVNGTLFCPMLHGCPADQKRTAQQSAFWCMEQMLQKPDWNIAWCCDFGLCCKSLCLCSGKQAISKSLLLPARPETSCVCLG